MDKKTKQLKAWEGNNGTQGQNSDKTRQFNAKKILALKANPIFKVE